MTAVTENCDERDHAALRCQGSWSIVMTGIMDHCDGKVHEAL